MDNNLNKELEEILRKAGIEINIDVNFEDNIFSDVITNTIQDICYSEDHIHIMEHHVVEPPRSSSIEEISDYIWNNTQLKLSKKLLEEMYDTASQMQRICVNIGRTQTLLNASEDQMNDTMTTYSLDEAAMKSFLESEFHKLTNLTEEFKNKAEIVSTAHIAIDIAYTSMLEMDPHHSSCNEE